MNDSMDCIQLIPNGLVQFNGPNPGLLSNRMALQDGDSQVPQSAISFTVPEKSVDQSMCLQPIPRPNHRSPSYYANKKSEFASAYEDDGASIRGGAQPSGKPQFLQLIIAKSMQSNFVNNLWNRTYLRKLNQLSNYQIKILDDLQLESGTESVDKVSFLNLLMEFKLLQLIGVFQPYSAFIVVWDVFQIVTYLLIFFWLPYKLSFETYYISDLFGYGEGQSVEIVLLCILASDVLVGCNLAFIYKGQIIKTRKRILVHYLKTYSFVDLVSLITISMQFFIPTLSNRDNAMLLLQISLCGVFYVLRTSKINKILAQIQEFFNLDGGLNDLLGLVKLSVTIIFIAHLCGCLWHGVAYYNVGYSWLDKYQLRHSTSGSKYNNAIYWATMTMTTVGYGDITPNNNSELFVATLTMFVATGVFAFSVNSIGIFVQNMYQGAMEYSRRVSLINNFMAKNKIPFELQTRIRSYLEYIWQEEQDLNDEEVSSIVVKLSSHLQDELQFQLRINILKNCSVLMKVFSDKMIKTLLNTMEEQSYSPEERIMNVNSIDDGSIYIITKGEIELIFEGYNQLLEKVKRNSLKVLRKGEYFGELSFFTDKPRMATAISRGFTKVFKIKRASLLAVLKQFPIDYEKYCMVRDRLMVDDYQALQMKCYSCSSSHHLINKCNYVHYCPDHEGLIKKDQYPREQPRGITSLRNNRLKSEHTLIHQKFIASRAREFYQESNYMSDKTEELGEYETHSNLINDAYEDDSRIDIDVPSQLLQRSGSRSFSKVSARQTESEEEAVPISGYFRKQVPPRATMQTAGFGGGMKDSVVNELVVEEISSSDSDSPDEEQNQLLLSLPMQVNKLSPENQRNSGNKVTFTRKQSGEDIVVNQIRQPSLRSRTYTQKKTDQAKSTITLERSNPSDHEIRNNARKRTQTHRKSTHTHTRINDEQNMTSMMDNATHNTVITHTNGFLLQFDKMQIFTHYNTLNNYDLVIKRYARAQKYFGKKRLYPSGSVYTFFFMQIKRGVKLRKLGEQLIKDKVKTLRTSKTLKKGLRNVRTVQDYGQDRMLSLK